MLKHPIKSMNFKYIPKKEKKMVANSKFEYFYAFEMVKVRPFNILEA